MNYFHVPQEETDAVWNAITTRGLNPKEFQLQAVTDLLASGPAVTVVTVTRGAKSMKFSRSFDDKWVREVEAALERGEFND